MELNLSYILCHMESHKAHCLVPAFFSIYVNDFAESISVGELHPYVDDTTTFVIGNSVDQVTQLLNVLFKEIKKSFNGVE